MRVFRGFAAGDVARLALSVPVDADAPPAEIRLFKAGVNQTEKGPFLFDDLAAEMVLAAAAAHDVDLMIDLEHLSLDPDSVSFDPDARGWYRLEVRNGELWAVGVRWTPDGVMRLREKRQRYISPAFAIDVESDPPRVTKILNIALTAMPATHSTPALVAAGTRGNSMNPKQLAKLLRLRREGKSDAEVMAALAIDIKSLQAVVKAMGGDPGGDLGALMATVAAYAQELADMAAGKPAEPAADVAEQMAADAAAPPEEEKPAMTRNSAVDELAKLRAEQAAKAKADNDELAKLRAEKAERDRADHREMVAQVVRAGGVTPAIAWADDSATQPSAMMAKLSVSDLKSWLGRLGVVYGQQAPVPPAKGGSVESTGGPIELSEYEVKRLTAAAEKSKVPFAQALENYRACRLQQLSGARTHEQTKRFGRRIEQDHVLASVTGRIGSEEIARLTNAVRPFETFGPTSQRAMEEFRTEYMIQLSTMPPDFTGEIGDILPSGALKETFPLDFSAVKYEERLGQNARAETPQSAELQVTKREFRAAKMGNLRRIQAGDFAYINSWQQGAAQFARARVAKRAELVVTLLEAGTSGYWGQTTAQATGIDGQPFFSASHKVHPFNPKMLFRGSATWGNNQGTPAPFAAASLTAEKANMLNVPYFDGEELQARATDVLVPTVLEEPARLLLTVQDIILDAASSLKSVSNVMGATRNEHYQSGFGRVWVPKLTGSDSTATWYLISRESIGMGFTPWVVSEDAAEELLQWDESSDYYKDTGNIRVESKIFTNATLVWPHGIRRIPGA